MKKQIWMRPLCIGLTATLCMGLLPGCGKEKEIDYHVDGDTEISQTEGDGGKTALSQFAGETIWEDSWTLEEDEDATIELTVDAQIVIPDVEEMYVVEVTVPEFDAGFKEHVTETLFGGNVVYYNDVEHLPKKELEIIYDDYKRRYEEATAEADREYFAAYMTYYENLLETAGDTYMPADAFDVNEYIGEKDGITYELYFSDIYGGEDWSLNIQYFSFYATNFEEICPEGYEGYSGYMAHPYMNLDRYTNVGENECMLSVEEAEGMARELLEELGLEYPVLAYAKPLMWGNETLSSENIYDDWPANGYVLTFEYGMDDLSFTGFGSGGQYSVGYSSDTYEMGEQQPYSLGAFAEVYVTDKGVIGVFVNNPMETTNISESVELLPLDTIKGIMKDNADKPFETLDSSYSLKETYTHMELIYFRVRDKENTMNYSYIPAWRLSDQIGDPLMGNWSIRNSLIINAIDGTWIDLFDEI